MEPGENVVGLDFSGGSTSGVFPAAVAGCWGPVGEESVGREAKPDGERAADGDGDGDG